MDNIVVDISFNQYGGLCTLAFLEEIDLKIGGSNIFKRSIILVCGVSVLFFAVAGMLVTAAVAVATARQRLLYGW